MSPLTWYVARAGGLAAFSLLSLTVVFGLTLSVRARLPGWSRFAVEDVHRFAGVLTGAFIGLHGLALVLDGFEPFSLSQLLVPGTASYRPLATAVGIVGAELLAALALASRYRARLSYRFWRRTHYLNFAVWALVLVHGLTAGTDAREPWALVLYAVATGSIVGLAVWRALRGRVTAGWALGLWPATAAIVAIELVGTLAFRAR